jgi:hypothetical protein
MDTCTKNILYLGPLQQGRSMGWYFGELPRLPIIPALFFLFHFFDKMGTGRGIHWGVDCLEGEGCCDHAHPGRGVSPWVS